MPMIRIDLAFYTRGVHWINFKDYCEEIAPGLITVPIPFRTDGQSDGSGSATGTVLIEIFDEAGNKILEHPVYNVRFSTSDREYIPFVVFPGSLNGLYKVALSASAVSTVSDAVLTARPIETWFNPSVKIGLPGPIIPPPPPPPPPPGTFNPYIVIPALAIAGAVILYAVAPKQVENTISSVTRSLPKMPKLI